MSSAGYDFHPTFPVARSSVGAGYEALAAHLAPSQVVRIDGYVGVDWQTLRSQLAQALQLLGVDSVWVDVADAYRSADEIAEAIAPYLGGDDPLFGARYPGSLSDFIDAARWNALPTPSPETLTVYFGSGASLIDVDGPVVYVDLPKDELQRRSQRGEARNLGAVNVGPAKHQYKRYYFVDWPVLNRHKAQVADSLDLFVDGSRPDSPTFMTGDAFRGALDAMCRTPFRPRPWFAPGPWGGQWLKRHIPDAPQDVPNYAWSFELIAPENGVVFGDGAATCEASFDWLMYHRRREVMGDFAERFGDEFPVRFDYLDTVDGGNLSLQCHPRLDYIRREFGETITQDETYYILDCDPGARVYLGFQAGTDPQEFRAALDDSAQHGTTVDVERFVMTHPAAKHDLFLIPNGTVHCSGAGNLVLEISATPYIFTFKMYDWLRADLDGKPRPLNIDRAFENLDFRRQGAAVGRELLSHPRVVKQGAGWRIVHLPTHAEHFYDVVRYEFDREMEIDPAGSPLVMMVVEGSGATVRSQNGVARQFNYAETFVIPAAAGPCQLVNCGPDPAMVVAAYLKRDPHHSASESQ